MFSNIHQIQEILEITSLAQNIYVDQQKGFQQVNSLMVIDLQKDLNLDASTAQHATLFLLFQESVVNNNTVTVFDFQSPEKDREVSATSVIMGMKAIFRSNMKGYQLPVASKPFVKLTLKDQDKHWPLRLTLSANIPEKFSPTIYQYTASMGEDIVKKSNDTLISFHQLPSHKTEDVHLLLFLDPSAQYDVTITVDVMATLAQFVKAYISVIIAIAYMIALWVLTDKFEVYPSGIESTVLDIFRRNIIQLLFLAPCVVYELTWCARMLLCILLLTFSRIFGDFILAILSSTSIVIALLYSVLRSTGDSWHDGRMLLLGLVSVALGSGWNFNDISAVFMDFESQILQVTFPYENLLNTEQHSLLVCCCSWIFWREALCMASLHPLLHYLSVASRTSKLYFFSSSSHWFWRDHLL